MDLIPMPASRPGNAESVWLGASDCTVEDLAAVAGQPTLASDCPGATTIERGIPIYACAELRARLTAQYPRRALMAEWVDVLSRGPGVLALRGAFDEAPLMDATTVQFRNMIDAERATGAGGDHFAKPGANDRVWNALEKLCERAPDLFAAYYGNDMLALVCEAWLGPAYQITSQINCVNPDGAAQTAHRDYHLGFMSPPQAEAFPAHVHRLSPVLTLQGAVAHVDMPLESGPTLYLPHSHKYLPGYLVAGRAEFQAYFDEHCVQLPLHRGDAVFFNPALMHAAGNNRSKDIRRLANLLQVSSAFGRAMEAIDRTRMSRWLYPALKQKIAHGAMSLDTARRAAAACAEGYAFPTNLDRDPPLGGLAPESQQGLMNRALSEGWTVERFEVALSEQAEKRR
jgi:ectoine hydroxylase-related dioxygenase (phytanoyl-CoA dioxygenase family)